MDTLIVGLDKRKIRKKSILHTSLTICVLLVAIAMIYLYLISDNPQKTVYQLTYAVSALLLIAVIMGFPVIHMKRLKKKKNQIIVLSEDSLIINSLIFKPAFTITLAQIKSVNFHEGPTGLQEIAIHLNRSEVSKNALINQLKKNSIHFNDYYLDSEAFQKLGKKLNEIGN